MSTSLNTPSLLFQNELEAVLKRLDFLVRSHTSFVGTTSLARSKFAPRVRTWCLSEANVLYWRKYLWHCWDIAAPGKLCPFPSSRPWPHL